MQQAIIGGLEPPFRAGGAPFLVWERHSWDDWTTTARGKSWEDLVSKEMQKFQVFWHSEIGDESRLRSSNWPYGQEREKERKTPLVVTTLKSTLLVFQPKQTSCDPNKTLEYSQGPSFESGQIWSVAQPQWSSRSQGERKTKTTPRSQSVSFQKVHLYLAQPNPTPPPPPTLPQS